MSSGVCTPTAPACEHRAVAPVHGLGEIERSFDPACPSAMVRSIHADPYRHSYTTLHDERLDAIFAALEARRARAVMDLGCGSGALIERLLHLPGLRRVVGLDRSPDALAAAQRRVVPAGREMDARVALRQRCLTAVDHTDGRFDAAVAVEVIEHLHGHQLSAMECALFQRLRPRHVVLTTPNADYNRLLGLANGERRHPQHRFEWGRRRFEAWATGVATRNGFEVAFEAIGPIHAWYGSPTQMAVFRRRTSGGADVPFFPGPAR